MRDCTLTQTQSQRFALRLGHGATPAAPLRQSISYSDAVRVSQSAYQIGKQIGVLGGQRSMNGACVWQRGLSWACTHVTPSVSDSNHLKLSSR